MEPVPYSNPFDPERSILSEHMTLNPDEQALDRAREYLAAYPWAEQGMNSGRAMEVIDALIQSEHRAPVAKALVRCRATVSLMQKRDGLWSHIFSARDGQGRPSVDANVLAVCLNEEADLLRQELGIRKDIRTAAGVFEDVLPHLLSRNGIYLYSEEDIQKKMEDVRAQLELLRTIGREADLGDVQKDTTVGPGDTVDPDPATLRSGEGQAEGLSEAELNARLLQQVQRMRKTYRTFVFIRSTESIPAMIQAADEFEEEAKALRESVRARLSALDAGSTPDSYQRACADGLLLLDQLIAAELHYMRVATELDRATNDAKVQGELTAYADILCGDIEFDADQLMGCIRDIAAQEKSLKATGRVRGAASLSTILSAAIFSRSLPGQGAVEAR